MQGPRLLLRLSLLLPLLHQLLWWRRQHLHVRLVLRQWQLNSQQGLMQAHMRPADMHV